MFPVKPNANTELMVGEVLGLEDEDLIEESDDLDHSF